MILVILVVAAAIGITFLLQQPKKDRGTKKRIALFAPAIHPAMDEIFEGFTQTIQKDSSLSYSFDEYNAQGNPTLLRGQAEEIILGEYDLVFTIGATCSHTMHELTKKKQINLPVIFSAVDNPVKTGLVSSLKSSKNNLTGVIEGDKQIIYQKELSAFLSVKPNIKQMLLVYDPNREPGFEEDRKIIATILKQHNVILQGVVVNHSNEIQQKVQPLLENQDAVLVLTDHTVVSGIDSLITLCNRYGVTLCTSELNSGDKGAALSFGVTQYEFGSTAASQAKRIIEQKQSPSTIPVAVIKNMKLKVNTTTMHKQGLSLSPEKLNQITQNGGIII